MSGPVVTAVREYVEKLVLDDHGRALAEIAIALAQVLDGSDNERLSGAMAQSIPGTARELRLTLQEMSGTAPEGDDFLTRLNQ